ncbi:MAG: hypothetical protein QG567_490, partial [Campylobacterota bacterium]|nr:hypothetical protein [Campylobacterota bacterium]
MKEQARLRSITQIRKKQQLSSIFEQESTQASFYEFLKQKNTLEVLITQDEKEARELKNIASFFDLHSFVLPDFRADYLDDLRSFNDELLEISACLNEYYSLNKKNKILIIPLSTATKYLPKEEILQKKVINFGDTLKIKELQ